MPSDSSISKHARIAINPQHLVAELDGDVVIMSIDTGTYYGLDAVGACVWKLLAQPQTFTEVVDGVVGQFEADTEVVERDLTAFLKEMQSEGIISINPVDATQSA
jgi:hypothetical protein